VINSRGKHFRGGAVPSDASSPPYIPRRFKAFSMSLSALDRPPPGGSGPSMSRTLMPGREPLVVPFVSRPGPGGGVRVGS
jgi:hypothetical protein